MLSFALYLIGSIACIAGLACVATLLGAAQMYVTATAGILLAVAIVGAAVQMRSTPPRAR
jgi:hypothetical protein